MCTLTFTDRLGPDGDVASFGTSYRLFFNRDELRTRGPEIAPTEAQTKSGVRYIAPTDSDAGGTWIAVNQFGVTVALLNGYVESKGPAPPEWTSRGALVRELADVECTRDLWARLSPKRLRPYRPSIIAVVAPGEWPVVTRWDGQDAVAVLRADQQLPITSSSDAQDEVRAFRRALYRDTVGQGRPEPDALAAYHRATGPEGTGGFGPCMDRPHSATRSHCEITVRPGEVRFRYAAGPPHITSADQVVTLRASV